MADIDSIIQIPLNLESKNVEETIKHNIQNILGCKKYIFIAENKRCPSKAEEWLMLEESIREELEEGIVCGRYSFYDNPINDKTIE